VSVCGTVAATLEPNEAFLGTWSCELSGPYRALVPSLSLNDGRICLPVGLCTRQTGYPSPVLAIPMRPPMACGCGSGILTGFPSTTALALALGTD